MKWEDSFAHCFECDMWIGPSLVEAVSRLRTERDEAIALVCEKEEEIRRLAQSGHDKID
jgi:hypothetical protein